MHETNKSVKVSVGGEEVTLVSDVYDFGITVEGICTAEHCNGSCTEGFRDYYLEEDEKPKDLVDGIRGQGSIWMPDDDYSQAKDEIVAYLPKGVERKVKFDLS